MRILQATSELYPFSKTGGLADMVAALGKTLARQGHQIGIVTPLYGPIREKYSMLKKMDWKLSLPMDWQQVEGEVYTLDIEKNLTVYFIAQENFFDRPGIYQENGHDYVDNADRYTFFSKAVLNLAQYLPWQPELVHLHDWQTAMVPLLLKHNMSLGVLKRPVASCLTIHNLVYQGGFPGKVYALSNLPWGYFNPTGTEFYGNFNFLKTGIVFSDMLTTVSPRYAQEILGAEYGANLNGVLQQRTNALVGILNGADYDVWKTVGNPALPYEYSLKNMAGKTKNKKFLQEKMGLPVNLKVPLFANIGRMAEQKGIEILIPSMEDMLTGDIQFICLGSGDVRYSLALKNLKNHFPDKVGLYIGYDADLAHLITAGSDFFIMPSRYEPCGLNQMYSLRYGTLPIVRATGGLADSVVDLGESKKKATGFKFTNYISNDLTRAILRAMATYYSPSQFKEMRKNAMLADFSWDRTARSYTQVYQTAIQYVTGK